MKALLDKLGEVLFWKIAMKPGRPLAYGRIGGAHFFGLPGNPVSVMVTFYEFVPDALRILQGQRDVAPLPTFKVPLAAPIRKVPGRTEFQRGDPLARTATAAGPCARPATRARASCRRCRGRTASSCCRRDAATSPPASRSTCSCSKG